MGRKLKILLSFCISITIIVFLYILYLYSRIIIKTPKFANEFNKILLNKNNYISYNTNIKHINNFAGKSTIFNIYDINDISYSYNFKIIDNLIKENLNVNIIDIVIDDDNHKNAVNTSSLFSKQDKLITFIIQHNIDRPLFFIKKDVLNKKLNSDKRQIIITDLNLNNAAQLIESEIKYETVLENLQNLKPNTKYIKKYKQSSVFVEKYDNLLTNSLDKILYVNSFKNGLPALFLLDSINRKIFITTISGNIINIIGGGSQGEGEFMDVGFCKPSSIKYHKNKLFIVDFCDSSIKTVDFETGRVSYFLKDTKIESILDFDFIDDDNLLVSTKSSLFIYNIAENKTIKTEQDFGTIYKIMKFEGKLYFFDSTNLKIYYYANNVIQAYVDLKSIFSKDIYVDIKYFFINQLGLYFVNSDKNEIWLVNNKQQLERKKFKDIGKIKDLIFFRNHLYICNDIYLQQLDLIKGNTKDIYLNFNYKNKGYFIKDMLNNTNIGDINIQTIDLSNRINYFPLSFNTDGYKINYDAPNYLNIYEKNKNNLILLAKFNDFSQDIEFKNINTSKEYYIIGSLYYQKNENSPIFIKDLKYKVKFSENENEAIEIKLNNFLTNVGK